MTSLQSHQEDKLPGGLKMSSDGIDLKSSERSHPFAPLPAEGEVKSSEFTLRASLCLAGSFSSMFCSIGFINAFGVFQEYYSQGLLSHKSASAISWLGSFNNFMMFAGTLFVGYLLEKRGPQFLLVVGSVIMIIALFMTALCKQYYQFFLAQGLLLGLGISFVILPAVATVPKYFAKSRGLALGVTIAGSSLGGVIWPIALRNLFVQVGFGWGVRIVAFIMLPLLATACLTVRAPQESTTMPKPKPDFGSVKNPVLILLACGLFFIYLGLFSPLVYMTTWSLEEGIDTAMAFYMLSIINAASLFGRILPGVLADRYGAYNMMAVSACTSGLVCTCWTKATSMAGIVMLSIAYGFCSGSIISLQGACAAQLTQPQDYGIVTGSLMSFISIPALVGSPINGQILGRYGYLGLSLFSGLAELVGMLIIIVARLKTITKLIAKV